MNFASNSVYSRPPCSLDLFTCAGAERQLARVWMDRQWWRIVPCGFGKVKQTGYKFLFAAYVDTSYNV